MKALLISGINKKSIGFFLAKHLYEMGWEVWICNRSAKKSDSEMWHERACDISSGKSITKLLSEISDIDLVLFLADTGTAFGALDCLSDEGIKDFINAKVTGSILFCKTLLDRYDFRKKPIKLIWFAGKPFKRQKNLVLYSTVNTTILDFVNEINTNYKKFLRAYYLLTPLILSPMGEGYIKSIGGEKARKKAQKPNVLLDRVFSIINGKTTPGLVGSLLKVL